MSQTTAVAYVSALIRNTCASCVFPITSSEASAFASQALNLNLNNMASGPAIRAMGVFRRVELVFNENSHNLLIQTSEHENRT